jgi:hypothetical protein
MCAKEMSKHIKKNPRFIFFYQLGRKKRKKIQILFITISPPLFFILDEAFFTFKNGCVFRCMLGCINLMRLSGFLAHPVYLNENKQHIRLKQIFASLKYQKLLK